MREGFAGKSGLEHRGSRTANAWEFILAVIWDHCTNTRKEVLDPEQVPGICISLLDLHHLLIAVTVSYCRELCPITYHLPLPTECVHCSESALPAILDSIQARHGKLFNSTANRFLDSRAMIG
jgi:hypothetical protein